MHSKLRHFLLGRWSHLIGRHPRIVLACAFLLALACILLTATRLEFQPDRNDLLARSLPWNRTFIDWQQNFPGKDDLIVIADFGESPVDPRRQREIFDRLARAIEQSPGIAAIQWRHDRSQFHPKTLRMLPWDRFQDQVERLSQSRTLLQSVDLSSFIGHVTSQLRDRDTKPDSEEAARRQEAAALTQIHELRHLIESIRARLMADDDAVAPTLGDLISRTQPHQYLTPDERFYFIRVTPRRDEGSLNEFATAIGSLRRVIEDHRPQAQQAGLSLGLTGIPVIEMDETEVATLDSTIASVISVVLILLLLMAAFYSVRTPLLAIASLLVGIAWSFGYVTLAVGHLQVISVVFTVMLLSLGVAYGIHIASRFELMRHSRAAGPGGFMATMRDTIETVGPGVFTGALTTAAAFATTLLTDFKGVAEMGEIAAVGIGLCLLAMFSVYPALLRLFRSGSHHIRPMEERGFHFFEERWVAPFARRPGVTLMLTALLTLASLAAVSQMRFDFDLLKLFPRGVESVDWQNRLAAAGRPIYFGASICDDLQAARELAEKMRRLDTVAPTLGGVGILFPDEEPRKIARLDEVKSQLLAAQPVIETGPRSAQPLDLRSRFQALQLAMTLASARDMPTPIREAINELAKATTRINDDIIAMEPPQLRDRLARLEEEYLRWRGDSARMIVAALDTSPLTPADLPADLLKPYFGDDGRVVLEIHPMLPADVESILSPAFLPRYVQQMESVDPDITGPAPQIYRSGVLIKESYQLAGLLALVVVFVLVYLDFLRLIDALLTLIPVGVGFAVTFGIMWCLGMQINPANIIVLPLMFGIGVDAGVHMLHRYRHSPDTRPLGLAAGTGKGITITNLATVLGFATLIFARHRGVSSLGFVLTTGIALTTLACWCVMPAILEILKRHEDARRKT